MLWDGQARPWFRCSACGRRCKHVCKLACRTCCHLDYICRHLHRTVPGAHRLRRLRRSVPTCIRLRPSRSGLSKRSLLGTVTPQSNEIHQCLQHCASRRQATFFAQLHPPGLRSAAVAIRPRGSGRPWPPARGRDSARGAARLDRRDPRPGDVDLAEPNVAHPFFACPVCARRTRFMYLRDTIACRRCHRLDWAVRHINRSMPSAARAVRLRRRLGCEDLRPFSPLPARRRGRNKAFHDALVRQLQNEEAHLVAYLGSIVYDLNRRLRGRRGRKRRDATKASTLRPDIASS